MSPSQMSQLHSYKRHIDDVYQSNIPEYKKKEIYKRVGAMLNDGNYERMTMDELREIARQRGISRFSKVSKDVLVRAIREGWTSIPRELEQPSAQRSYEAQKLGREELGRESEQGNVGGYGSRGRTGQSRSYGSRGRVGCDC